MPNSPDQVYSDVHGTGISGEEQARESVCESGGEDGCLVMNSRQRLDLVLFCFSWYL